ncbi:response regulator transcription factor [Pseudovibrio sp. Tun.PSC04-5.I4]|uniref:response regulator transcription factor n=1 Tax=Pseudovibrio sp. Tun.PSC04-5.I4 TaxID=1798213 RepID=UPI00088CEB9B|nr:response regulator transcription factor [Pseudovibrio sp. Tun.PSC04-5.I4]SDR16655.1 two-component system, OmpR family, response regulator TctD [Pseudovibrio sp. Tun.PSC04-5.I4]
MKVLVIEDCDDVAFAIKERLKSRGNMVDHCANGNDGYELARVGDYDCVLLDINLPGADGFSIMSKLRAENIDTPILVLTARGELHDKIDMLDMGADDYMVKPFSLDEVEARLRAIFRRQTGQVNSILQVGNLQMDQSGRMVLLDGDLLDLGRREMQLLEYLMQNKGRTLNKESLVSKLFGFDEAGSLNAVELLVSRLRKKLTNAQVQIVTQRGVGYQLIELVEYGA